MKQKKLKRTIFPIGVNAHNFVDNIMTLYRSSNDLYDGTLDYIFFKVLNLSPEHYFNMHELNELTEQELYDYNLAFENYDNKYQKETNDVLSKEISEVVLFIRKNALEEELIEEISPGRYLEKTYKFGFTYIIKSVMKYYDFRKRGKLCIS